MQLCQAYTRHAHERHAYVSRQPTWQGRYISFDMPSGLWYANMNIAFAAHTALDCPTEEKAMPPPPQLGTDVLDRTIRNIEQAQGRARHHTTAAGILQAQASIEPDLVSLPSSDMPGGVPAVGGHDAAASISSLQVEINRPINLTSDLAASTTLLQNLRVRNSILVADLARVTLSLQQHDVIASKLLSRAYRSKTRWKVATICSLTIWLVYLWWCRYMRVEFEYIRKRRGEVYGL